MSSLPGWFPWLEPSGNQAQTLCGANLPPPLLLWKLCGNGCFLFVHFYSAGQSGPLSFQNWLYQKLLERPSTIWEWLVNRQRSMPKKSVPLVKSTAETWFWKNLMDSGLESTGNMVITVKLERHRSRAKEAPIEAKIGFLWKKIKKQSGLLHPILPAFNIFQCYRRSLWQFDSGNFWCCLFPFFLPSGIKVCFTRWFVVLVPNEYKPKPPPWSDQQAAHPFTLRASLIQMSICDHAGFDSLQDTWASTMHYSLHFLQLHPQCVLHWPNHWSPVWSCNYFYLQIFGGSILQKRPCANHQSIECICGHAAHWQFYPSAHHFFKSVKSTSPWNIFGGLDRLLSWVASWAWFWPFPVYTAFRVIGKGFPEWIQSSSKSYQKHLSPCR